MFFSWVNLCALILEFVPLPCSQWHIKQPGQSVKSAGDFLQLNTHTALSQWSWSKLATLPRHSVGTHEGNKLTWNSYSSGNNSPQPFQLTEPLWTVPQSKENWCLQADFHFTKCRLGMIHWTFSNNPHMWGKSHNHPTPPQLHPENAYIQVTYTSLVYILYLRACQIP